MSIYSTLIDTTNSILDIGYNYFFVDCSGGNMSIYMPELLYDNILIIIKRIDTSINTCDLYINPTDNKPIDGSSSTISLPSYNYIKIISFNNNWYIIDKF